MSAFVTNCVSAASGAWQILALIGVPVKVFPG